jgi:hypothetical protein
MCLMLGYQKTIVNARDSEKRNNEIRSIYVIVRNN